MLGAVRWRALVQCLSACGDAPLVGRLTFDAGWQSRFSSPLLLLLPVENDLAETFPSRSLDSAFDIIADPPRYLGIRRRLLSVAGYSRGLLDLKGSSCYSRARRIASYFTIRPTERAELLNF